jgi:methylated-DNA-[protein]-cysteine S-methyltransferase
MIEKTAGSMIEETIDSPIGALQIAFDEEGALTRINFESRPLLPAMRGPLFAPKHQPNVRRRGRDAGVRRVVDELDEYFAGKRTSFSVATRPHGTPFQLRVWRALEAIPYGETISYAELAERIGNPTAVRAVGAANGANPIPVIIPCHRVIGSSGKLVGYGGGLDRKETLLALERSTR